MTVKKFKLALQSFKKGKMPICLEHKDTSHICFYSRDLQEVVKVPIVNDDFHSHLHPWPSLQPLLSDVAPPYKPCSSVGTLWSGGDTRDSLREGEHSPWVHDNETYTR
uniref:Uncharacterized protein n=1 Tax=Opuntia streptacantha TaxID=393608 RepID=A0A7C8ZDD9_OPUST